MIPNMRGFGRMLWKTLAESTNSTRPCSAHFTEDYFEAEGQSDSLVLRLKDEANNYIKKLMEHHQLLL